MRQRRAGSTGSDIVPSNEASPLAIPAALSAVRYVARSIPGCAGSIALHGANCQRFAYAVIRHYGCEIADFRSSELWADEVFTQHVNEIEPLDLLFFNREAETYGAHVGVYMGAGLVAHLAKHVGTPTLWTLADFAARPEYANLIGAKRPIRRAQPSKTVGSI